ncbi:MAG: hypothetical protein O3A46_03985, partial [Candidatus Poribacteria bacterium]|nr:hypothetical protein [Candidatus Poribacteria bacterium]
MSTKDYRVLSDLSEIDRYDTLAVDTEGDSPHHSAANMSGISFSGEPFRALWLPIDRLDARRLTELLRRKRLVFHNAKYDLTVLERHGVDLIGCDVFDTMLAAHLLNENRPKGLKSLACDILGETNVVEFKDLTNQLNLFGKTPTLLEYA